MDLHLFQDMLVILGFSVVIVFVLQRLKLPSIIGFLITGIIIGPYGLSLIEAVEQVEMISEIGVILLLFVIGMELSIKELASIRKTVFIGGAFQVGVSIIVTGAIYYFLGFSWNEAVFVGFLFSLSSTAIVLKTLQERQQISQPHARNALGILIFQDLIVVPMMLFTPMIAGESSNIGMSILILVLKSAVVVVATYILAKYVVPRVMYAVAKTNSKELFLLVTITLCFAIAFFTSAAGLSLALGAFIAGLIISESEYSFQATSIILPFRELFTSFFFVSVGMLLDLSFFAQHVLLILLLVLAVFLIKSAVAAGAVAILKYPPKTVILTGLALFQVGEFAFILSKVGIEYHLIDEQTNQYFLSVSILSMLLTPFVILFSENMAQFTLAGLGRVGLAKKDRNIPDELRELAKKDMENHLVIIGYGLNGRNLAKAAYSNNIPFVAVELNPETVRVKNQKGVPIIYGDAAQPHILETVNLAKARAAVVAISNEEATVAITKTIRSISDSLYLVVRTRFTSNTSELLALGADEVIPEEFETSIQIFSRILQTFLVPEDEITHLVDQVRADNYDLFKGDLKRPKTFKSADIVDFNITSLRVNCDTSPVMGKPLKDLNLRVEYGITILAINRRDELLESIQPEEVIRQGDTLYIQGNQEAIERFHHVVK